MIGFNFIKTNATEYVFLIRNGKVKKEGAGLSFFYYAINSSISIVPIDTKDQPFIFNVISKDFQQISIQGQFTYYIKEPQKIYHLLDFTVDANKKYIGDALEKLPVRIMNILQVITREFLIQYELIDALKSATKLVQFCKERIKEEEAIRSLGIEILDISILKIATTPEMSKALETSTREKILQDADAAIYERRNYAVEQERKIKENELETELRIEQKNKEIEEEKINAEIALEEKNKELTKKKFETSQLSQLKNFELNLDKLKNDIEIEQLQSKLIEIQNKNFLAKSEAKSRALELELKPIKELPSDILEVMIQNNLDSKQLISKAFLNLAKGHSKIGNLNISPELLSLLLENTDEGE
jgi:hypothetical protein